MIATNGKAEIVYDDLPLVMIFVARLSFATVDNKLYVSRAVCSRASAEPRGVLIRSRSLISTPTPVSLMGIKLSKRFSARLKGRS